MVTWKVAARCAGPSIGDSLTLALLRAPRSADHAAEAGPRGPVHPVGASAPERRVLTPDEDRQPAITRCDRSRWAGDDPTQAVPAAPAAVVAPRPQGVVGPSGEDIHGPRCARCG